MKNLKGKTALITGSTRLGIGATTALALADLGVNVILNYGTGMSNSEAGKRADALEKKIKTFNKNVITLVADITKEGQVKKLFKDAVSAFGSVDILINNAGGTWVEQDFAEITTKHWNQVVKPEIDGTFYCIREVLPLMRKKQWGRIVNICLDKDAMELALNAEGHILEKYPYDFAIAKESKRNIVQRIALSELKYGITCNNIMPGIIEELENEKALKIIQGKTKQSIFFNPTDVSDTITYLCSQNARGVTGSDIKLPGNIYTRLG